nr:hypothetical protein [Clostridiales bacterium]
DLYGSSASAYSSIVWIGPDDLNDKNVLAETAANGDIYRSYTGADLRNGQTGYNVYKLLEPDARLTKSGYYRVLNGYIVVTDPIESSISGSGWYLELGDTVAEAKPFRDGSWEITLSERKYIVKYADLVIRGKAPSGLSQNTHDLNPQNIGQALNGKSADVLFRQVGYQEGIYYYEMILLM